LSRLEDYTKSTSEHTDADSHYNPNNDFSIKQLRMKNTNRSIRNKSTLLKSADCNQLTKEEVDYRESI
jgi:hypothetical protein